MINDFPIGSSEISKINKPPFCAWIKFVNGSSKPELRDYREYTSKGDFVFSPPLK
jgi:hypothetical protein